MPRKKKTEVEIEKQSVEVIENVENEADTDVEAVKNEDAEYENTAVSNEPTVLQENEPIEKKPVKRRKRKTEAEKEDSDQIEFIILKEVEDGEDSVLVSIDDENEFNTVLGLMQAKIESAGLFDFDNADE